MQRAHRVSTRLMGAVTFGLGLAMIVITIARGGGPLAVGVVVGVMLAVLGAVRFSAAGRGT